MKGGDFVTEQQFLEFFNVLDEEILKNLISSDFYNRGQEHYNKLILEGWSPEEATYDLIIKSSYRAMKYAVFASLYFYYNVEPNKPKTKEELKKLIKLIK